MSEPENHTLHLLRELREDVQKVDRKIDALDRKVDAYHGVMRERVDSITQALAGEIAANDTSMAASSGDWPRLRDVSRQTKRLDRLPSHPYPQLNATFTELSGSSTPKQR